jgi:hypothetical protein
VIDSFVCRVVLCGVVTVPLVAHRLARWWATGRPV